MKAPLVSIVTPVYNAADFLDQTIKTVQAQTYENWELLLIDDVSSDNSLEIIKAAQKDDVRIKLIQQPKNAGAAKARNAGTLAAKGRFIAFLDADDLWVPEKLEKQVGFALSNEYAFVFSSYQFADEAGEPTAAPVTIPTDITYEQSLKNPIIWTSTVLLDVDLISRDLMLMPDVRRGQDAATWWRILRETKIKAYGMQESLAYYRRTNASLSANKMKAIKRTWYLYRNVEKLNLVKSSFVFCFYAFNAVRKRV